MAKLTDMVLDKCIFQNTRDVRNELLILSGDFKF